MRNIAADTANTKRLQLLLQVYIQPNAMKDILIEKIKGTCPATTKNITADKAKI